MKSNQIQKLLFALAVLLGLAYFAGVFDSRVSTIEVPDLNIEADQVERVRISSPTLSLVAQRQGALWQLSEPVAGLADSATVSSFLRDLAKLEPETVVSTNPDRYSTYGVDSTGKQVTLFYDGEELDLVIGNTGPDFQSAYIRVGDAPDVLLAKGSLFVADQLDRWRDKSLLDVVPMQVQRVEVSSPASRYDVVLGDQGWQIVEDGAASAADSAGVMQWLGRFRNLKADGFMPDLARETVQDSTTHHITFSLQNAGQVAMQLMSRDSDIAAITGNGNEVFKLFSYRLANLVPDAEGLKADSSN